MRLVLTIENAGNLGVNLRDSFLLETGSMTIGRGADADWQLPDVSRIMSAVHCRISVQNKGYTLTDLSRNGLAVDGKQLDRGASICLNGGETIVIGPFAIKARLQQVSDGEKTEIASASRPREAQQTARPARHRSGIDDERTVVGSRTEGPRPTPAPITGVHAARAAAGRHAATTAFVMEFASGAGLDPDDLAGLTDPELAYALGEMMRLIVPAIADLSRSMNELRTVTGSEVASTEEISGNLFEDSNINALRALFNMDAVQTRKSIDSLEVTLAALKEHDIAVFGSMQTALFKLLNALAPTTIESETRGKFGSRRARNWDAYGARWEDFTGAGPNGMLDVLLAYFREAYDTRIRGLR